MIVLRIIMPDANLKIIERDGWAKSISLEKSITRIGSSSFSDIQLPVHGIFPVHLQIFYSPDLPSTCRLANLGDDLEIQSHLEQQTLPTYTTLDVQNGDEVYLAGYTLVFSLPNSGGQVQSTRFIEAALAFPDVILRPDSPLEGRLTVKNLGNQKAVQFNVSLSGLPEDCYIIDPIPLIYPSATEDVRIQLFHKNLYPEAGRQEILVTITAPASYLGEKLVLQQAIFVAPLYSQKIEIHDDTIVSKKPAPAAKIPEIDSAKATAPVEPDPMPVQVQATSQIAPAQAQALTAPAASPSVIAPTPADQKPPVKPSRARSKVVVNPFEDEPVVPPSGPFQENLRPNPDEARTSVMVAPVEQSQPIPQSIQSAEPFEVVEVQVQTPVTSPIQASSSPEPDNEPDPSAVDQNPVWVSPVDNETPVQPTVIARAEESTTQSDVQSAMQAPVSIEGLSEPTTARLQNSTVSPARLLVSPFDDEPPVPADPAPEMPEPVPAETTPTVLEKTAPAPKPAAPAQVVDVLPQAVTIAPVDTAVEAPAQPVEAPAVQPPAEQASAAPAPVQPPASKPAVKVVNSHDEFWDQ
jgi:hypothetical protein